MSAVAEGLSKEPSWKTLYLIGAIVAFVAVAGSLTDIVITAVPGWQTSTVPASAVRWFAQLSENPFLGLRNLDLLNMTISVVSIPMYVALYGALRRTNQGLAALSLVVVTVATAVFVAHNAALSMLDLSRQYFLATTDAQRIVLEAAATSLLAGGAHGSLGTFAGFFLSAIATLLMAVAMLGARIFGRLAGWIGILGTSLLIVYLVGTTFGFAKGNVLMAVAVPGGLLMIAWNIVVATNLLRLSTKK